MQIAKYCCYCHLLKQIYHDYSSVLRNLRKKSIQYIYLELQVQSIIDFMGSSSSSAQEELVQNGHKLIMAQKRIKNQLQNIKNNPAQCWTVVASDWNKWVVTVTEQTDSPFHTIPFNLIVNFPNNYPEARPTITFQQPAKIFHPNICWKRNSICQTTLKTDDKSMPARKRIENVIQLLKNPNQNSALNAEAANEIKKNGYRGYFRRALYIYRGLQKNPSCGPLC